MMIINGCESNDGFGYESELRFRLENAREEDDSRPVRLENDNNEQLETVEMENSKPQHGSDAATRDLLD
ncbi:hypothetical protein Hanom_Chr03g00188481 [Helianthus anomalus]